MGLRHCQVVQFGPELALGAAAKRGAASPVKKDRSGNIAEAGQRRKHTLPKEAFSPVPEGQFDCIPGYAGFVPMSQFTYAKKFGDVNPWRETARSNRPPSTPARPISAASLQRLAAPNGSSSPYRPSMAEVMSKSPYPYPQTSSQKEYFAPPDEFVRMVPQNHKHRPDHMNRYIDQRTRWHVKGEGAY